MIIEDIKGDIEAGESKIIEVRDDITDTYHQLVEEIERKNVKLTSKIDSLTVTSDEQFSKINKELTKFRNDCMKL